ELDYERGQAIIDAGIPGVKAVPASRRIYPEGDLASAVLGFVGKDQVGLAGLEADYDDALAGEPGSAVFERDSFGNEIVIGRREVKPPKPGADLVLTIDRYLQRLVEEELDAALEQHQATGGAIIIQDPTTGAILAMAVRPSFSLLNLDLSDPANEDLYRNRAVTDLYEPGSVFKLVTIAAAIDHGAVTPETPYYDSGLLVIGDSEIRNWNEQGYGTQTIRQVLQNSLNLGSAFAAQRLGAEAFYDYVQQFGFGQLSGIGIGGEAEGHYRTPDMDIWSPVDLATNSFGQGISVTPLQMINAVSAIVNGGELMRPYIVQEVVAEDHREVTQPQVIRRVISEETSRTMRQLMNDVVDGVPGHLAQVAGYSAAGKTGTANIQDETSGQYSSTTIASFVGAVPADEPRFVMLIKIDGPRDDEFGSTVAAPIFARLAPPVLEYLKVPPEDVPVAGEETPG
ncbi:MAG TPA: penicillin-binding protein 2, partial [Dehalococcoidia bacterium]|nr:penicillin-binding protein 2 [Dehalococcoidia bacterium]